MNNAIEDFEEAFREIATNQQEKIARTFIEFFTNNVISPYPFLKEIVYDIWTNLSEKKPVMNVTSDYRIVEPFEYD